LVLKSNQKMDFKSARPLLIIGLNEASKITVNKKSFSKQGDFLFVQSAQKISLSNKDGQEYTFAVLELK